MNNSISFLNDISVDGNVEVSGVLKALNTNVWPDTGSETDMAVHIQGTIHGYENQALITDYGQLLGIPIQVRKNSGIGENTSLYVNVNDLGVKECRRYIKDGDETTTLFEKHSVKEGQIIILIWNGDFFIVSNVVGNDFTDAEKSKLSGIEREANKYVHPETHSAEIITGLADVATSGSYKDLNDTPIIPVIPDIATEDKDGLMSAGDKGKLDNLDSQFEAVTSSLEKRVDEVSEALDTQIEAVNQSVDSQIGAVSQSLTSKIESVTQSLGTQIEETNASLNSQIKAVSDNAETQIEQAASALDRKLDVKIQELDGKIEEANLSNETALSEIKEGIALIKDDIASSILSQMDSGNTIEKIYQQTLIMMINDVSIDWVFRNTMDAGELISNVYNINSESLNKYKTMLDVIGSQEAMGTILESNMATHALLASQTISKMIIDFESAMSCFVDSISAMKEFVASVYTMELFADSEIAMTYIVNSEIAMKEITASTVAMSKIVSSDMAMELMANNPVSIPIYATSSIAMKAITANKKATGYIVASDLAMERIALSGIAMSSIATSSIAMDAVSRSSMAMHKILSSSTGRTTFGGSSYIHNQYDLLSVSLADKDYFTTYANTTAPTGSYTAEYSRSDGAWTAGKNDPAKSIALLNTVYDYSNMTGTGTVRRLDATSTNIYTWKYNGTSNATISVKYVLSGGAYTTLGRTTCSLYVAK